MKKHLTLLTALSFCTLPALSLANTPAVSLPAQAEIPPTLYLTVANVSNQGIIPLNSKILSRKAQNQRLCWEASSGSTALSNKVEVEERFNSPAPTVFSSANSQVRSSQDGLTHVVLHTANSMSNHRVANCWKFDKTDPLGTYTLAITVGDISFPSQTFELVK